MSQVPMQQNNNVESFLVQQLEKHRNILSADISPSKAASSAARTIFFTPQLRSCSPASIANAVLEAASIGLEIDSRGLAYLVPYGQDVRFQLGYKGMMHLAYKSGKVDLIYAEEVCSKDTFSYEMGLDPKLSHIPALGDRGEFLAVYAVAKMKAGGSFFCVIAKSEIDKIKQASKAGFIWNNHFGEMAKKTAIRRLCKTLPLLDTDIENAIASDEQAEAKEVVQSQVVIETPAERLGQVIETPTDKPVEKKPRKKKESTGVEVLFPEIETQEEADKIYDQYAYLADKNKISVAESEELAAALANSLKCRIVDAKIIYLRKERNMGEDLKALQGSQS